MHFSQKNLKFRLKIKLLSWRRKKEFYTNTFLDLDTWIVSPKVYNLGFCTMSNNTFSVRYDLFLYQFCVIKFRNFLLQYVSFSGDYKPIFGQLTKKMILANYPFAKPIFFRYWGPNTDPSVCLTLPAICEPSYFRGLWPTFASLCRNKTWWVVWETNNGPTLSTT